MTHSSSSTRPIARAALDLLLRQGIKKTTMEEVAQAAGVTRVTVYRHFQDKKSLVHGAFQQLIAVLEEVRDEILQTPDHEVRAMLPHLECKFSSLPSGDLPSRTQELKRLYPDVFEVIHEQRLAVLSDIFRHVFDAAEREGLLRPGLNRKIVQMLFWEVIVNLVENPEVAALGLQPYELHRTVQEVFLHGILKQPE